MKLLTSIGTGKYEETEYVWKDKRCRTCFFPVALVEWLNPQSTVVFLTEGSKQHCNWKKLEEQLKHHTALCVVDIPDGHSEAEIWEIFDKIVQSVKEGEEVVVDITHAFRSLPLIFFVVTAFLRAAKQVQVRHVLYGCFIEKNSEAPVIDLTLMLDLLDWMEGVRRFRELGDARFIGKALRSTQDALRREGSEGAKPRTLKPIGDQLLRLSDELSALRVLGVMETAGKLKKTIENAVPEVQQWAKPFGLLMEEVRQLAGELACDKPDELNADTLQKQHRIISTLIKHRQFVQAMLLQREWLVNYVMWRTEKGNDWLRQGSREKAEDSLNAPIQERQNTDTLILGKYMEQGEIDRVVELWSSLRELRNDFAHSGMRDNPEDIASLKQKVREFARQLGELLEHAQTQS